jgi:hypothetical protein
VSGAAQAPPQETHLDPELQDLRQQLNYKNAEATNLRTNLAAVQSELAAAKIAAARGASSGGGRQDGEASRLRREIQQLRTKLEFAEQARREMQHPPTAPQVPQRHTTAVQTDRAEHPCAMTSALFFLPSSTPRVPSCVRVITYLRMDGYCVVLGNVRRCGDFAGACDGLNTWCRTQATLCSTWIELETQARVWP